MAWGPEDFLPEPFRSIERVELLFRSPPAIEPLDRLSAHLTAGQSSTTAPTRIFVKREDCNSGLCGGGGNKLRKLEYVLTDALKQSPRPTHIVTEGGIQSNHVRQVAAAAAKLGFESTTLLISDRVPDRSSTASSSDAYASRCYTELGNVQLTELMGANHVTDADTDTTIGKTKEEIMKKHLGAYFIPSGASTHPLGGLGYARWAYEVEQQELEMAERFDVVVVALNSGSTLAGMLAGFALAEQERKKRGQNSRAKRVIGVLTTPIDDLEAMKRLVVDIANATGEKIGLDGKSVITADDFKIDDRWHGGAYGRLDERTKESIKLAVRTEALVTDPVYSGKALTGLCEMVKMGEITGNALFVHTGGVMSLSAYPDLR